MNSLNRGRAVARACALVVVASACLGLQGQSALAQSYPVKPVRFIVAYPPGGTSDLVGRALAEEMTKRLGENFVVENRSGAGGRIGTEYVARSAPDGYNILIAASGPVSYLPALGGSLPYDVRKDFETIGNIVTVPNLMVVPADSAIRSLKDLADFAKANPGKTNFGSAGVGSSGHIAGELFNLIAGVKLVHVPYRGSGPALVGLMGGEIQVMFENLPSALTLVRGGKLRGIAVLSAKRSPSAPEFPTTAELGMPDLTIASSTGLLVSASTPRPVVEKLEAALQDIAKDPEAGRTLAKFGADVDYMTAARYRVYLDTEITRWAEVGKRAGVSVK